MNEAKIKAGDIVKVVDWVGAYPISINWFLNRMDKLKTEWLVRYAYGDSKNIKNYTRKRSDNRKWQVLFVDGDFALITHMNGCGSVYLIKVYALSRSAREMTLSEIEAELGYAVKIVNEE